MSKIELRTRQVGPWSMNTYALICPATKQSILFDPGADPNTLQEMLAGSTPIAILLTHSHIDHVEALDEMRQRLQVPVYAHNGPAEPNGQQIKADHWLQNGDTFQVGQHTLHVHYTPGHIGNQICFTIQNDNNIIVGDTVFDGGPGRTWSHEGFQTTLQTLRQVVLAWPDEAICHPGHGPSFRLGDRRAQIAAFIAKDHGNFYGDATWEM